MPVWCAHLPRRGLTAAPFKPTPNRYAEHLRDRTRTARAAALHRTSPRSGSKNESVSALLRSALGVVGPGVNRLRRFNITLRYANRRAVTALAMLQ